MLNRYKLNPIGKARDILMNLGSKYYIYAVNGLDIDANNKKSARNKANQKFPVNIQEVLNNYPDVWKNKSFAEITLVIPRKIIKYYIESILNSCAAIYAKNTKDEEIWAVKNFFANQNIKIEDSEIDPGIPEYTGIDIRIKKYDLNIQVKRIIQEGYKIDHQARLEEADIKKCKSMNDILRLQTIQSHSPNYLSKTEACAQIPEKVKTLSEKYQDKCQYLDLLLQVKLDFTYATPWLPPLDLENFNSFNSHNWRSVSILNTNQSLLIKSTKNSPLNSLLRISKNRFK